MPAAAEVPTLFQSALELSGTPPFPVPDLFYEGMKLQDSDMQHYLAPVSRSDAVAFSSSIHAVLHKEFPTGAEVVQAGLLLTLRIWSACLWTVWAVHSPI